MDVKDVHLPDLAVQAWVLEAAGIRLDGIELMRLNRACVYPDLSNLFTREDVTAQVRDLLPEVPHRIRDMKACLAGPLPEVEVGPHCTSPYDCPFAGRCWPDPVPFGLDTLYLVEGMKRALEASPDIVRATAYHQAGHAIFAILEGRGGGRMNPKMADGGDSVAFPSNSTPSARWKREADCPPPPTNQPLPINLR